MNTEKFGLLFVYSCNTLKNVLVMEIVSTRKIAGQVKRMKNSSAQNSSQGYWKSLLKKQVLWCTVFFKKINWHFYCKQEIVSKPFENSLVTQCNLFFSHVICR